MSECIFCKIAAGEIPAKLLYQDDEMLAFHDIKPAAPVHFLVIPRAHIASCAELSEAHAPLLGRMLVKASELAREQGLNEGFRTIINTGRIGGQEVYHLHIHVLGGSQPLGAPF
ncbi:MAG: histidine triad nucleotide-binding protein [Rhodocyclaceae bacterium]|nr:histidine triad nucleotide-binding protein [Rhodocyclaceae bacterium]